MPISPREWAGASMTIADEKVDGAHMHAPAHTPLVRQRFERYAHTTRTRTCRPRAHRRSRRTRTARPQLKLAAGWLMAPAAGAARAPRGAPLPAAGTRNRSNGRRGWYRTRTLPESASPARTLLPRLGFGHPRDTWRYGGACSLMCPARFGCAELPSISADSQARETTPVRAWEDHGVRSGPAPPRRREPGYTTSG